MSHPRLLLAVVVGTVVVSSTVRADLAPPPPPPPTSAPAEPGAVDTVKVKKPNALLCGCASSRFLGTKVRGPAAVGVNTHAAWLHGETRIDGFTNTDGKLAPAEAPFAVDADERGTGGASRLIRVRATGDGSFDLGIMRRSDSQPRDVLSAALSPSATAPSSTPPQVTAMWLEPVEARDRRDCGAWLTQRLAFELAPGSSPIDAFAVTDLDSGAVTLVDARHVGAFGIGRVGVCDHGFGTLNAPQRLEVAPVSALGGTGAPWGFAHDGSGSTPVTRLSSPSSADSQKLETPYPMPGEAPFRFSWLSVGGMWILLPATGILAALLAFIAWRLTRRRMAEVVCASCNRSVPVDVLDHKTDGFFCPHCGATGMWKGNRVDVDVTRL
jgi:hypothetical protein